MIMRRKSSTNYSRNSVISKKQTPGDNPPVISVIPAVDEIHPAVDTNPFIVQRTNHDVINKPSIVNRDVKLEKIEDDEIVHEM